MLTTTSLSATAPRQYVRWTDLSLHSLVDQADRLAENGCADSCELRATDEGLSCSGDGPAVPLTLGEFRQVAREIEAKDAWLTDRENVSCYTDRKGETHLDVVNFGGFIVTGGHLASRSVNPW